MLAICVYTIHCAHEMNLVKTKYEEQKSRLKIKEKWAQGTGRVRSETSIQVKNKKK